MFQTNFTVNTFDCLSVAGGNNIGHRGPTNCHWGHWRWTQVKLTIAGQCLAAELRCKIDPEERVTRLGHRDQDSCCCWRGQARPGQTQRYDNLSLDWHRKQNYTNTASGLDSHHTLDTWYMFMIAYHQQSTVYLYSLLVVVVVMLHWQKIHLE